MRWLLYTSFNTVWTNIERVLITDTTTWDTKFVAHCCLLKRKMSYKWCLIAYILSKKSLDLIAHRDQGSSDDWKLQITKYSLQITNRPQGSQGSSEDCNGQSVEETEEDEHWKGEETDSSSDNNNTVSFLQFHHFVWHLSLVPGLPQWDGSWWRKVCSRKGCGELKTAILSSWRIKTLHISRIPCTKCLWTWRWRLRT